MTAAQSFGLLACALAVGLLPSASAFPGDCTPIEAGSYTIDPRSEHPAEQPTCERGYYVTAACAAVDVPYVDSFTAPAYGAAWDACNAVTATTDQGTVVENVCRIRNQIERTPDAMMIATKAAAVAHEAHEAAMWAVRAHKGHVVPCWAADRGYASSAVAADVAT